MQLGFYAHARLAVTAAAAATAGAVATTAAAAPAAAALPAAAAAAAAAAPTAALSLSLPAPAVAGGGALLAAGGGVGVASGGAGLAWWGLGGGLSPSVCFVVTFMLFFRCVNYTGEDAGFSVHCARVARVLLARIRRFAAIIGCRAFCA